MYYPHPALTLPSKETVIWHYFSLAKFLSLLNDSKLYFPRSDKFEDQMEGRFSAADKNLYEIMGNPSMPERIEKGCAGCAYINCWVMSEEELFLMWSAYSSLEEGIAIKSSVGNLISSLDASDTREIYISNVSYIDYEKQRTFDKTGRIVNALAPYFCKRKYFSQERELRLVHYDFHIRPHHNIEGMEFDVALETLIIHMKLQSKEGKWVGEDGLTAKSSVRKNGFAQKNIDGEMFEAIVSDEDDTSSRLYFTTSHSELVDKLVSNKQYAEFLSETGTELKFFKQMSIINKLRILSDFFDLYSFLELTEEDIYPLEDVIAFIDEDNSAIKKS